MIQSELGLSAAYLIYSAFTNGGVKSFLARACLGNFYNTTGGPAIFALPQISGIAKKKLFKKHQRSIALEN